LALAEAMERVLKILWDKLLVALFDCMGFVCRQASE
jgi:hypothetical protein